MWRKEVTEKANTNLKNFQDELKELMEQYEMKQVNEFIVKHTIQDEAIASGELEFTFIIKP